MPMKRMNLLLLLLLPILVVTSASAFIPLPGHTHPVTFLEAKKKTKKQKKKPAAASRGFGKQVVQTKEEETYDKVISAKSKEIASNPTNPTPWLELGSVLVKRGDYAEAEQVFGIGNTCAPGNEMLNGAHLSLAGNSESYFGGITDKEVDPHALDCPFDIYEVGQRVEDFHTTTWTAPGDKPRVQVSKEPLLPQEECTWAIDTTEEWAAENGGWTSQRHAQAATTDLPIKDVPKLLEWFNDKLETTLFPMLQARYPEKISSVSNLRAHDAFIVKYDAERGQASLAKHLDESAFSFTIALNDDYQGGGTCFEAIRKKGSRDPFEPLTLNASAGGVVCFPGTMLHGGSPVTKGIRYIIPLFCYLHENASGREKGYVAHDLEPLIEKADKRRKLMSY